MVTNAFPTRKISAFAAFKLMGLDRYSREPGVFPQKHLQSAAVSANAFSGWISKLSECTHHAQIHADENHATLK